MSEHKSIAVGYKSSFVDLASTIDDQTILEN